VNPDITIYGKPDCTYCTKAKEAFDSVDLRYAYKTLGDELNFPDDNGVGRPINPEWRTNGMVDLQAMWVMCGQPTPFIVVDDRGFANLQAALEAVSYRDRKKQIVARKRREQSENNPRTDA